MHLSASNLADSPTASSRVWFYPKALLRLAVAGAVLTVVTGLLFIPAPAIDLGVADHLSKAGLLASWRKGDTVVLVRHAERCDRSRNPCLADASGITAEGGSTAAKVGEGFKRMGLAQTDIYASPLTRTVQTASSMFGKSVITQGWLKSCQTDFQREIINHKTVGRNLLLVTHSSCINELGQKLNASGASYDSQYASALFVSVDKVSGKPRLLGCLNADEWASVEQKVAL